MNGNDLAILYEFSYVALNRNLKDLTHADSLLIPELGGNCINWVLGHIIFVRGLLVLVTGAGAPLFSEAELAAFGRGTAPLKPREDGVDLDRLKLALEDSQNKLVPALLALSDAALAADAPEKIKRPTVPETMGGALARLCYHEGYHNGQIGILRRLAGKEGTIR